MTIVDNEMSAEELLKSIERELDGYTDGKWRPERTTITKERVRALYFKLIKEKNDV